MRMSLIIYLIIFLVSASCESKLDKAIPSAQLSGAIRNATYTVTVQENLPHYILGRKIIDVKSFVPYDVKREQLRPTILSILKEIKIKYPEPEEVKIVLLVDELLEDVGHAYYDGHKMECYYKMPSLEEIEKHNAEIMQIHSPVDTAADPLLESILNDKTTSCFKGFSSLPWPPDLKNFKEGMRVYALYKRLDDRKKDYCNLLEEMSKELELPVSSINKDIGLMVNYYGYASSSGNEIISLDIP